MKWFVNITAVFLGILTSGQSRALDHRKVLERYRLVGVISEDTKSSRQGIVVIKDREIRNSLTLRSGDLLPYGQGLRVHRIERRYVHLADGDKIITIGYIGAPSSSPSPSQLADSSGETFDDYDGQDGEMDYSVSGQGPMTVPPIDSKSGEFLIKFQEKLRELEEQSGETP